MKNIVQPCLDKKLNDALAKSLEEFSQVESFKDMVSLFYQFKDSRMMYRVPFKSDLKWSKLKTRKSNIGVYDCLCSSQF